MASATETAVPWEGKPSQESEVKALGAKVQISRPSAADALGTVAREHVLQRLKEAVQLAKQDLPDNLEQFRRLLEEATDQVDAWALTRDVGGLANSGQPRSQLACALVAQAGAEPLGEFLLIPFGEVAVERPLAGGSFVFEQKHAASARNWFDQMGRKLAIDYEHQSFERYNTRADGLRPAAGWIGRLEVRDDGLWACDVTWTERARELLRSGEYRYFSPVVYWTDEDYSDVAALGPVALTNDPAMRGARALAASCRSSSETGPDEIGDGEEEHAVVNAESAPETASVPRAELEAAQEELVLLRRQLVAQEADAFVERGMRLGKILDRTSMDWREDYLRDPETAEARLQRAPVLLPPGRVIKLSARGEITRGNRAQSELQRNEGMYRRWGIEAEDLAAYDRALAAGRIRRFGVLQNV